MQCPNCHFENMPGNAACVRCGSAVAFSGMQLAVYPPRAAAWTKQARRWVPWRPVWYRMRDSLRLLEDRIRSDVGQTLIVDDWTPARVAQSLIPGWLHWSLGHRARGMFFALLFWPAATLGVLLIGSGASGFLLGIAAWAQWGSLIDLWTQPDHRWRDRLVYTPLQTALLLIAVYMPLGWAVSRVATVRRMEIASNRIMAGDVLLIRTGWRPWKGVEPGQLALYSFDRRLIELGSHRYLQLYGEGLDRVIAGPGCNVEWRDGTLLIDGQPSDVRPLERGHMPRSLTVRVPPDHFCIFPTNNVGLDRNVSPDIWHDLSLVPYRNIRGRPIARTYPPSRWAWVD